MRREGPVEALQATNLTPRARFAIRWFHPRYRPRPRKNCFALGKTLNRRTLFVVACSIHSAGALCLMRAVLATAMFQSLHGIAVSTELGEKIRRRGRFPNFAGVSGLHFSGVNVPAASTTPRVPPTLQSLSPALVPVGGASSGAKQ